MRTDIYRRLTAVRASRRGLLRGAAGAGALALASGGGLGALMRPARAQGDLRAELLKIPGIGAGQPTDADWRKVGAMTLGGTRETVREGEFAGVELTFMGLNNQNLHNFLFRGFLKPWEQYTGATLKWIDLAQVDYNARLQQAIATGTVVFDILEMGAPFEGDVCGRGLASEMPTWVRALIEMDDYVDHLQAPVGTWGGKTYRVSIDADCHSFNYRRDVFDSPQLAQAWADEGHEGDWAVPDTWQKVQEVSAFLAGKTDPMGSPAYGYLDAPKAWGGFGFYFLGSRATAYAKHPDDPAFLFDPDTMKPRVDNPAWLRAITEVVENLAHLPPDQIDADPNTTAYQQFLAGTGAMLTWWGDVGSSVKTSDGSVVGDATGFSILPGSRDVYNARTGEWETPEGGNHAPNMAHIGWGIYVMSRVEGDEKRKKAAWSAAAHLGGKDLSLWTAAYPSGFQPYRQSHFRIPEWVAAGYDEDFISDYLTSQSDSYNHPNAAIEPRIPGIFQYYSVAEDELAKVFAGQMDPKAGAEAIAAAWERITDRIGRDDQIALYKASIGL